MPERRSIMFPMPGDAPRDLPHEAPNRPLGQDLTLDGIDGLLSALGIQDGLSEQSSQAGTLGVAAGMLPLGKLIHMLSGGKKEFNLGDHALRTHMTSEHPVVPRQLDSRISGIGPEHAPLSPEELAKGIALTSQVRRPGQ